MRQQPCDTSSILFDESQAIFGHGACPGDMRRYGAALCLSGGGIRSASFCLGVLQAMAQQGLLTRFHYLSTVSGGGYIGAWLWRWIRAEGGNAARVEAALGGATEPGAVSRLREWTNYLAPQSSDAAAEAGAGVVLWLRNVLLNWLVFGPALLALAMLPVLYASLLRETNRGFAWTCLSIGFGALFLAVACASRWLPSHVPAAPRPGSSSRVQGVSRGCVTWLIVVPALVWAWLVPVWYAGVAHPVLHPWFVGFGVTWSWPLLVAPACCFLAMMVGYGLGGALGPESHRHIYWHNAPLWALACVVASMLLGLGAWLARALTYEQIAVLGPAWVILSHVMQTTIYVGLRGEVLRGDLDREWLALLNARKILAVLPWAALACASLLLPPLILYGWRSTFIPAVLAVAGFATGPVAAFLGKTAKAVLAPMQGRQAPALGFNRIVLLFTAAFAGALFMLLGALAGKIATSFPASAQWPVALLAIVVLLGIAWALGWRINVNRFSLNGVYRNRLSRAFLGPAQQPEQRLPEELTGFDPRDNPRLHEMWPQWGANGPCLFPLVNVTLNLTASGRQAWAERKAAPFTMTPLACGYTEAGRPGAYAPSKIYGGQEKEIGSESEGGMGLSLATAMTISGAAVSPDMGYHSSPATAFLMTLFNVRLGAWLPNPANATETELRRSQPANALLALGQEMLGQADDTGRSVYLSDGGHFDNLGLYEVLRRRCRLVVVVDAGQDPGVAYGDLGQALRKAAIDLGVAIDFEPLMTSGAGATIARVATATIRYPDDPPDLLPDDRARLLYLRPYLPPPRGMDVVAYAASHTAFPHDSTVDQFFSESQFESYRGLGCAIGTAAKAELGRAFAELPPPWNVVPADIGPPAEAPRIARQEDAPHAL